MKFPKEPVKLYNMGSFVQYKFESGLAGSTADKKVLSKLEKIQDEFGSDISGDKGVAPEVATLPPAEIPEMSGPEMVDMSVKSVKDALAKDPPAESIEDE